MEGGKKLKKLFVTKCFEIKMLNKEITSLLKRVEKPDRKVLMQDFIYKIKIDRYMRAVKRGIFVLCFLFLLGCILKTGYFDKLISWSFRRTTIKLFHKLDWFQYRNQRCFLQNPSKRTAIFDIEDCEQCENMNKVNFINDTLGSHFMKLVKQDYPVVLSETGLAVSETFESVVDFVDLFLSVDDLSIYEPCRFASNVKRKVYDHRQLLQLISSGDVTSFYAHWENCAEISFKSFRRFYVRPEVLPANIQLTNANWVMLCSDYQGNTPKLIDFNSPLFVMLVLKGRVEINISPRAICNKKCPEIIETLHKGNILLLTDALWRLKYIPFCPNNETILIGINGYFD